MFAKLRDFIDRELDTSGSCQSHSEYPHMESHMEEEEETVTEAVSLLQLQVSQTSVYASSLMP